MQVSKYLCQPNSDADLTILAARSPSPNRKNKQLKSSDILSSTGFGCSVRQQTPQKPWLREPNRVTITSNDIANGEVLTSNTSRLVVKVGTDVVVKVGPQIDLTEAESTCFIQDNTTIPVPTIFDAYSEDGKNYVIMEYKDGILL